MPERYGDRPRQAERRSRESQPPHSTHCPCGAATVAELRRLAEHYHQRGRDLGALDGADMRSVAADLRRRAVEIETEGVSNA